MKQLFILIIKSLGYFAYYIVLNIVFMVLYYLLFLIFSSIFTICTDWDCLGLFILNTIFGCTLSFFIATIVLVITIIYREIDVKYLDTNDDPNS